VMPRSENVDPLFRLIRFFVAQKRFRFFTVSRIPAGSTALSKIGFSKSWVRKKVAALSLGAASIAVAPRRAYFLRIGNEIG